MARVNILKWNREHDGLSYVTEGDARVGVHARDCKDGSHPMYCRCWCHGITKHLNGTLRPDAQA